MNPTLTLLTALLLAPLAAADAASSARPAQAFDLRSGGALCDAKPVTQAMNRTSAP